MRLLSPTLCSAILAMPAVLAKRFHAAWMHETVEVARMCTFSLEELRYEYPEESCRMVRPRPPAFLR